MTKPKNFPGAKNKRRIAALQRLRDKGFNDNERYTLQSRTIALFCEGLIIKVEKILKEVKELEGKNG